MQESTEISREHGEPQLEEKVSNFVEENKLDNFKKSVPTDVQQEILKRAVTLSERGDEDARHAAAMVIRSISTLCGDLERLKKEEPKKEKLNLSEMTRGIGGIIDKMIEKRIPSTTIGNVIAEVFANAGEDPERDPERDIKIFSDDRVIDNLKRLDSGTACSLASYLWSESPKTEDINALNNMGVNELKEVLRKAGF